MPKYFYILYFRYYNQPLLEYLFKSAKEIFTGKVVTCTSLDSKYARLIVSSKKPIYPWEIIQLESLFGPYISEIFFSHDNASAYEGEVASMEEVGPQHVFSVGAILNFNFWDIVTLKRFFFVQNMKKLVQNSSHTTGFYNYDNFLCFFLQSDDPIPFTETDFYIKTIIRSTTAFFKTTI